MTVTSIQPVRPYTPSKLKDHSKQFLYAIPPGLGRKVFTRSTGGLGIRAHMVQGNTYWPKGARFNCPKMERLFSRISTVSDDFEDGVMIDTLTSSDGPTVILAILPISAKTSSACWDREIHNARQAIAAAGMNDVSIYPTPRFIAPILASANPWFGNWGEAEGCRSQAAMMAQAEFYHRQGWDTLILDHEARWSVNGWGLQQVTPEDIARLREEEEL